MPDPVLYEINARCWLRELSKQQSAPITLGNVPDSELASWQQLGFTHIWLMGVWSSGPRARACALSDPGLLKAYSEALPDWQPEDVAGSPYAIAAYTVPDALGGDKGLEEFRRKLRQYGMRLLLDFVPNHFGLDHPWIQTRPELFVQSASLLPETFEVSTGMGTRWLAHGRDPYFAAWKDTAQVDYRLAATRAAMTGILQSIAERCDGVRCDMAMLVLHEIFGKTWQPFPITSHQLPATEFWPEAIASVKKNHPEFLFLAEAYWGLEPRLQALGFDYTYDKELYDRLVARDAAGVQRHLLNPKTDHQLPGATLQFVTASAHFLENHDEHRIASILSLSEHRAAALVMLALPGMRFLHEGQLSGARIRTPVQLLRRVVEPKNDEIEELYEQLLSTLPRTAIGQGQAELLKPRPAWAENPTAENFVLVQWQFPVPLSHRMGEGSRVRVLGSGEGSGVRAQAFDLVVVNLAPHRSQCYVTLNLRDSTVSKWLLKDLLGTEQYVRDTKELQDRGLYLDVPEHGAQIFHFEPDE